MDGILLLVQETRMQLRDDDGAAHLFMLGHSCLAEPGQLVALAHRQARVRIGYKVPGNMLALIATSITLLDRGPADPA